MHRESNVEKRSGLFVTLIVLGLVTALAVIPSQFRSEAGAKRASGLFPRTTSQEEGIDFYDIRMTDSVEARESLGQFRRAAGKDAPYVADEREKFVRAEESLRTAVPTLKVEYNQDLRVPEVIGPDAMQRRAFLTAPSSAKRDEILRNFIKHNNELIGVSDEQIDSLKTTADYTNPDGNLSYVLLEQFINGIPVSRGEVKAGFTRQGEMIRVINNLAPGLDYANLSKEFGDPVDAVRSAAGYIDHELRASDTSLNRARSTDLKVTFGDGYYPTTAEKLYFPTEPGVARTAWRVLIWKDVPAYEVTVDAESGALLRRENIVKDQTQSVTYNVWSNTTSTVQSLNSPAPLVPGPIDPSLGTQGVNIPRTMVTLIGNEPPYAFNNNGWITDGGNTTQGNNTLAGLDRATPNGVDAPVTGSGSRVFDFAANPPPGVPAPGDDPLPAGQTATPCAASVPAVEDKQRAAVVQMFYVVNRYHDEMYRVGFTEPARNFQTDNFGRGGTGADAVLSEGQDCSGTNNANFASSSTDGSVGRMQMYIFNRPVPFRDGTIDADVIIHELTHGLTNRLHTAGITGTQGSQMHEGNSDWYAHTMLSKESDPINGIYTTGGYVTLNWVSTPPFNNTANFYYGIRRFPKAVLAFTGGPMNRPHNPLTYADIDPAQMNLSDGAFPPESTGSATAAHDGGEIWSSMLWEVRALLVTRLGWTVGNRKVLQLVTDGMKLAPANPNMLASRNSIILAAQASAAAPEASADVADVREGFRRRGMGFSAANPTGNTVIEAFDVPNAVISNPFSVSDSTGDNDGFPEPGENLLLNVSISNNSGSPITNVMGSVVGGGSADYGTIADGATVSRQITYTVPGGAACGSMHTVTINGTSSIGALTPQTRSFRLGQPVGGAPITFTNSTAITIPSSGPATPYPSNITVSGVTGNKVIRVEVTNFVYGFPDDVDFLLVGPGGQKFIMMSDVGGSTAASGNVVLVDSAAANLPTTSGNIVGEFKPTNEGANDAFAAPAPAGPYSNPAPGGTDTFTSVFGTDGSTMNGTWNLYIVDDLGGFAGSAAGWKITFESNEYACSLASNARADFDGDGRTDLSVFRPAEGNWYLNRSTAGFAVLNWGISSDTLVPGDYDGDLKTDTAVFRPSNSGGVPDFYILNSASFTVTGAEWGVVGDVPVVADYNGDGKSDLGVFRPSTNTWFILNSSGGSNTIELFGTAGDIPMAMDTNGDGRSQLAVFRPSSNTWYIARPTGTPATNFDAIPFGTAGDRQVPADYDGDNRDDVAMYRPSTGVWYILRSSDGGTTATPFGIATDVPVPGDYDGDGRDDLAVYRTGTWYVLRSTSGLLIQPFGVGSDAPIPAKYIP